MTLAVGLSCPEGVVLMAESPVIALEDLPREVREGREGGEAFWSLLEIPDGGISFEDLEKSLLRQALRKGGNVSRAARLLGMSRRTFQYRMEKFGLAPASNCPAGRPTR